MFAVIEILENLETVKTAGTVETTETNTTLVSKDIVEHQGEQMNQKNQSASLNRKNFVGMVDSLQACYNFCNHFIGNDTYTLIQNKTLDEVKTNNDIYKPGKYLVQLGEYNIVFLEKTETVLKGYLYNSHIISFYFIQCFILD